MNVAALPTGVDVASYQGNPDWNAVAASGIKFAFTKATEGTNYTNPTFESNWNGIKAAGMYRGAYHYAKPNSHNGIEEANWFAWQLTQLAGVEEGDLLALDIEEGNGDLGQWVLDFVGTLEAAMGFKPLIYTSPSFITEHGLNRPELAACGLWLASWGSILPPAPAPWDVLAFWQYSDHGTVPGIQGIVDMNRFDGAPDRIPLYGKPASVPPVVIEPEPEPTPIPTIDIDAVAKATKESLDELFGHAEELEKSLTKLSIDMDDLVGSIATTKFKLLKLLEK